MERAGETLLAEEKTLAEVADALAERRGVSRRTVENVYAGRTSLASKVTASAILFDLRVNNVPVSEKVLEQWDNKKPLLSSNEIGALSGEKPAHVRRVTAGLWSQISDERIRRILDALEAGNAPEPRCFDPGTI